MFDMGLDSVIEISVYVIFIERDMLLGFVYGKFFFVLKNKLIVYVLVGSIEMDFFEYVYVFIICLFFYLWFFLF